MAICPFCRNKIDDQIARFGGHCPKCFIEIPGEETPTDPGAQVQAAQAAEQNRTRTRMGIVAVVAGTVLLAGGVAGYNIWAASQPKTDGLAMTFPIIPMDQIPDDPGTMEAAAPAQAPANRTGRAGRSTPTRSTTSSGVVVSSNGDRVALDFSRDTTGYSEPVQAAPDEVASLKPMVDLGDGVAVTVKRKSVDERGPLTDPEQIRKELGAALKSYGSQIKGCYNQRLKTNAGLRGTWELRFTIAQTGNTSNVQVVHRDSQDDVLEGCMVRVAATWTFPELSEPQPIEIPYKLGT